MVRSCSENDRRKITQNNIEVDAEIKECTGKTEEKVDGRYKEGHERKKPKWGPVENRKQWSLGVEQRKKILKPRYIYIYNTNTHLVVYEPGFTGVNAGRFSSRNTPRLNEIRDWTRPGSTRC